MIGAKLKIALLYDVWNEDPVVAAAKEEAVPARKPRKKVKKVKKEKTDREEIFEALQKAGARAFILRAGWASALAALPLALRRRPDL